MPTDMCKYINGKEIKRGVVWEKLTALWFRCNSGVVVLHKFHAYTEKLWGLVGDFLFTFYCIWVFLKLDFPEVSSGEKQGGFAQFPLFLHLYISIYVGLYISSKISSILFIWIPWFMCWYDTLYYFLDCSWDFRESRFLPIDWRFLFTVIHLSSG